MRADRANRTFVAAATLAGVGQLLLGTASCGALMFATHRLLLDGAGGMDAGLVAAVAMGLLGLAVAVRGLTPVRSTMTGWASPAAHRLQGSCRPSARRASATAA